MFRSLMLCGLILVTIASLPAIAGSFVLSDVPVRSQAVMLTYDPADGNLSVDGNGVLISVLELKSPNSIFEPAGMLYMPEGCFNFAGDVQTRLKLFFLHTEGVANCELGDVLPTDLTAEFLLAELEVDGSIKPSGMLTSAPGGGPYLYVVPEPGGTAALGCALLALCCWRVTRTRSRV
jgi:hypothetical protein